MSAEEAGVGQNDDDKPPQRTRRVPVRTVGPGDFMMPGYHMMDLPEDVAGQWDEDAWSLRPPGV